MASATRTVIDELEETMSTTAEKFSARFGNDGSHFEDRNGVNIEDACLELGGKRTDDRQADRQRWLFADGSVITVCGGGWDLGYDDCYCWQGVGHTEECIERNTTDREVE